MLKNCEEEANNKNINWEFFGWYLLGGCCAEAHSLSHSGKKLYFGRSVH